MRIPIVTTCIIFLVSSLLTGVAGASETAKFQVHFSPNELGGNTTVQVDFSLATTTGRIPSPVTDVDLRLPPGVSLGSSTLGLATCTARQLKLGGVSGCSPNSLMGLGHATVKVPFGPAIVTESVTVDIFMGRAVNGHTSLLFYADAETPVFAQLIFPSELLEGVSNNFPAELNTVIPLTPSVPGAPNAAVVRMHSSLGPEHILYSKRIHGKVVHYRPIGIAIPSRCPTGGFRFGAVLTFEDGSSVVTSTSVPCGSHFAHH
jgi:hypothetical protein